VEVRATLIAGLALMCVSCSGPAPRAEKTETKAAVPSHEPPADLSTRFPLAGQTKMELVPDHLLGKDFLPGGNLAAYKTRDGQYQMFLIKAADAQKAAFILLDWKTAMPDAKYLAHMGGYYGLDAGKPVYVFAKGPYLAGLVGLVEAKADPEARRFAARL
jgi:hypothetical protein